MNKNEEFIVLLDYLKISKVKIFKVYNLIFLLGDSVGKKRVVV